jgi:hypothetical protein
VRETVHAKSERLQRGLHYFGMQSRLSWTREGMCAGDGGCVEATKSDRDDCNVCSSDHWAIRVNGSDERLVDRGLRLPGTCGGGSFLAVAGFVNAFPLVFCLCRDPCLPLVGVWLGRSCLEYYLPGGRL